MAEAIDLTEVRKNRIPSPCDSCIGGFCNISQYTDTKTGHLMQRTEDCHETCQRFQDYIKTITSKITHRKPTKIQGNLENTKQEVE